MATTALMKLIVYVPPEAEEKVRLALGDAGAGHIGVYSHCAFVTRGTGHYKPLDGARPYEGRTGELSTVDECRIETVCDEKTLPKILAAMRAAHPYEEIAYDIAPLLNRKYARFVPRKENKKP